MLLLRREVKVVMEEEELTLDKREREARERIFFPREEEGAWRPHPGLVVQGTGSSEAAPALRAIVTARPNMPTMRTEVGDIESLLPLKRETRSGLVGGMVEEVARTHAGLDVKWRQRCPA
jgi:hypothetical protein